MSGTNGRSAPGSFIAKAASYQADLESIIAAGLRELGLSPSWAKGRSVLLKPNLVEPCRDAPQINTHPAVVRAAAEVFRRWGAREVIVAEGPGHCRDAQLVLDESGLGDVLDESRPGIRRLESRRHRRSFPTDSERPRCRAGLAGHAQAGRPDRFASQDEDAPLGGRHALAQELVRGDAWHLSTAGPRTCCITRGSVPRSSTSPRRFGRTWRSSTGSSAWKGTGRSWGRRGMRAFW